MPGLGVPGPGGGGMPGPGGGVWSQGVPGPRRRGCLVRGGCLVPGVPGPGGCTWSRGGLVQGGAWSGGLVPGAGGCLVDTPQDGNCCGRYASYWNAF